jgi:hypothetical protein
MASTTLSILTPTITGATITAKAALASSETMTIQATTAQTGIDTATLHIRVENQSTTASVSLSLAASATYQDGGIGAATVSIATATTVMIGGQFFESARFKNTAGTIIFTQTGTGPTSWEAYQKPRASE